MDESPSVHSPAPSSAGLPSIKTLFVDSWHTFTKSFVHLLLLGLIFFAAGIVWFVGYMGIVTLALWGVIQPFTDGKMQFNAATMASIVGSLGLVVVFVVGGYVLLLILFILMQAAEMVVIDEYAQTTSVGRALKIGWKKIFPLIAIGIVTSVIIFGGFFFLIIPAILFALFFAFASYEVVLNNNSTWGSIKRSTGIVMHHFGGIFIRMLLIFLLSILMSIGMQYLLAHAPRNVIMLTFWIPTVINILFSWYALVYSITLYKQARSLTPADKNVHMVWILVVSLLGWLIFIGVAYGTYRLVTSPQVQQMIAAMMATKTPEKSEKETATYVPSSCGVEAVLPSTKDTYKGQQRQWTYDEVPLLSQSFTTLNPQAAPIQNVQATYIWYKNPEEPILEGDFYKVFPGVKIMCTDNTRGLTLETYKGLMAADRTIQADFAEDIETTKGGVPLHFVLITRKDSKGETTEDPGFIGVSKDGKKLLFVTLWAPDKGDPKTKAINADEEIILNSLRFGITGTVPTATPLPQQVQYNPPKQTYVAPTIEPGALGSKEWKEQFEKEYQEARAATGH